MSYLKHLKRAEIDKDTRWIVKTTKEGKIREVKQLFNPNEYKKINKHKRKLLNQQQLIALLEAEKDKW